MTAGVRDRRLPRAEVHAASHLPDRTGLLLHAVRPLLERAAEVADRAYFVPHWRRGPHVRIVVEATEKAVEDVVLPAARELVGDYLAGQPAPPRLDPAEHLAAHRLLAEREGERGPLLPWYRHGEVVRHDHDDRVRLLGSPEAADLLVDFYTGTTPLTFDALRRWGAAAATVVGFDLIAATAHCFARDGVTNGFVALRSHAEAFLSGTPEGRALRPEWDRHHEEHGPLLAERVRALVDGLDAGGGPAHVRAWVSALRPVAARARELAPLGLLPSDARAGAPDPMATLREVSPFHRALADRQWWQGELPRTTWFRAYRLLLNVTYLHLTRLGATPPQRFLLCHSAANAVEDAYGVSAADLVAR